MSNKIATFADIKEKFNLGEGSSKCVTRDEAESLGLRVRDLSLSNQLVSLVNIMDPTPTVPIEVNYNITIHRMERANPRIMNALLDNEGVAHTTLIVSPGNSVFNVRVDSMGHILEGPRTIYNATSVRMRALYDSLSESLAKPVGEIPIKSGSVTISGYLYVMGRGVIG